MGEDAQALMEPMVPSADEPTAARLDDAVRSYLTHAWSIRLLGTGWIRRDVAVALLVRIVVVGMGSRDRQDAVAMVFAAQAARKLRVNRDEIAVAMCAMGEPPSLGLLAWVAQRVGA